MVFVADMLRIMQHKNFTVFIQIPTEKFGKQQLVFFSQCLKIIKKMTTNEILIL